LSGYIPTGVEWRQLNYGQGEGQVEISGCEWGIYQTGSDELTLQLEIGEEAVESGMSFAQRVAETVCGQTKFKIILQGTAE
jgi:hypothetical protein